MGVASPATVLLWVLALRPSAGTDAIMVPPARSSDLLEVDDDACAQWQQQLVSGPTALTEYSEYNWFVGVLGRCQDSIERLSGVGSASSPFPHGIHSVADVVMTGANGTIRRS